MELEVRLAHVVKPNSSGFPAGLELEEPRFKDIFDRLSGGPAPRDVDEQPELIQLPTAELRPAGPTPDELLQRADECGIVEAALHARARFGNASVQNKGTPRRKLRKAT